MTVRLSVVVVSLLALCVMGCKQQETVVMIPLAADVAGADPAATEALASTAPADSSASTTAPATSGTIATTAPLGTDFAGTGTAGYSGDGGGAVVAQLNDPEDVALDLEGNTYIADTANSRVRRVDAVTGVISTVAGDGTFGFSGDGGPATGAQLKAPTGVSLDDLGNIYIADALDHRIRMVDAATGIISTLAGNGTPGFSGDGGPAADAVLNTPIKVEVTPQADRIFIVDSANHRIRKIQAGNMLTVVGNGTPGGVGAFGGDGGPAADVLLNNPTGLAFDAQYNLFIADTGNARVRHMYWATGIVTTLVGTGEAGFAGDGGPAASSQLSAPTDVVFDSLTTSIYVVDTGNRRIRRVVGVDLADPAAHVISTVAGDGFPAPSLSSAIPEPRFTTPLAVTIDTRSKMLLVADTDDQRIRQIELPE